MVNAEEVEIIECEECFEHFNREDEAIFKCDRCISYLCEDCFKEHSIECFGDNLDIEDDKYEEHWMCGECGEYYEEPKEAEECCK